MHRKVLRSVVTSRSCEVVLSRGDKNINTNVSFLVRNLLDDEEIVCDRELLTFQ